MPFSAVPPQRPLLRPLPWVLSLLLHGAVALLLLVLPAGAHRPSRLPMMELSDRRLPPPPPPEPPPEPAPPPPSAPKRVAMQRIPSPARVRPPAEPPAEPPPRPVEPPADAVPPSFGLKLSGTATAKAGQGVQVPEGDTLRTSPERRRAPRDRDRPVAPPSGRGFKQTYERGEQAPLAVATTMPKIARKVVPEYPEKARDLGIEGRVILELTVDGQGKVIDVRVVTSLHPLLDQAAVAAARKMRFEPGTVNGTPVTLKIPVPFTFVLD